MHRWLGSVGHQPEEASRPQAADGVARDHGERHGQDQADDAGEEAAERRDDDHDERVDVEGAAHHPGLHEVLQQQVRCQDDQEHDGGHTEPAVAEGDDHGQPATEEGADVRDVAADEVRDHDREHERQTEQEAGEADDHRDDRGHRGAAPPVVAEDLAGVG